MNVKLTCAAHTQTKTKDEPTNDYMCHSQNSTVPRIGQDQITKG